MARKMNVSLGDQSAKPSPKAPAAATKAALDAAHKLGARAGQPARSHKAKPKPT